jgi:hypothetical protein
MGPVDYSLVVLAKLLKKKYNIDDELYEEIRGLSSMSANVILPDTEEYKSSRLKKIKELGDKWNREAITYVARVTDKKNTNQ